MRRPTRRWRQLHAFYVELWERFLAAKTARESTIIRKQAKRVWDAMGAAR